jgi:hypothetical protein
MISTADLFSAIARMRQRTVWFTRNGLRRMAVSGWKVKTEIPVQRMFATRFFLHLSYYFLVACLVLIAGCSGHANQSAVPASAAVPVLAPGRPTLTELTPNLEHVGNSGILVLKGTNFVAGTTIRTPPGLNLRNIRVNGPTQIMADYTICPNSWLGYLNVTVTTPAGTSEPARFAIYPGVAPFGVLSGCAPPAARAVPAASTPVYRSFDVGIHAGQVANPDGSQTDAYLEVSFTDDKGHPVAVGGSYHSDMDNVDNPDADDSPGSGEPPNVTSYSFASEPPVPGNYVLHIKSSRSGSFDLEMDTTDTSSTASAHEVLGALGNIPTYPGSDFELKFVCRDNPFSVDLDSGGLQPPHGAFSFAQPLTSEVRLPAEEKALGVVIYYDPAMEPSSFRALLDGSDVTNLFHIRSGELQLVSVPFGPGQHLLTIRANNKAGQSTEQQFHIQH